MEKFKVLFLSHLLSTNTPTWGNRDRFSDKINTQLSTLGSQSETSHWYFSNNHIGTHIDSPRHFIAAGKSITDFDATFWLFRKISCIEIHCTEASLIGIRDISLFNINHDVELLLIKTGYEQFRGSEKYWKENPGIDPKVGSFLRRKYQSLRAIGLDSISIVSYQHRYLGRESHLSLLYGDNPVLPIEDMSLKEVNVNTPFEEVVVAPIRVIRSNGSPVTVIAKVKQQPKSIL